MSLKDKKLLLKKMQSIAISRNGFCQSKRYLGRDVKLKWKCSLGHSWFATPGGVVGGSWCPLCANKAPKRHPSLTVSVLQDEAIRRGGKLITSHYNNAQEKLTWECAYKHQWNANANSIRNGTWCPQCQYARAEEICRAYFEALFRKKFIKVTGRDLKWLISDKGAPMELDGYCDKLKLAFEHQGKHHTNSKHRFIRDVSARRIQSRDKLKQELCKKHGVTLIQVHEIGTRISFKNVPSEIVRLCKDAGVKVKSGWEQISPDWKSIFSPKINTPLLELQELARQRGGKLLSDIYVNALSPLEWQCAKGHVWMATPAHVKDYKKNKGTWCKKCSFDAMGRRYADNLVTFQEIASAHGGKCISSEYKNAHTKLRFECAKGHLFEKSPHHVKTRNQWCPQCYLLRRGVKKKSAQ